jgi:hypothetical protein
MFRVYVCVARTKILLLGKSDLDKIVVPIRLCIFFFCLEVRQGVGVERTHTMFASGFVCVCVCVCVCVYVC